jgi:glycosyltransferase involved in cell wall biosynthesis
VDIPKPLVSAIIPTHNHGQYLSRALDSLYAQEGVGEHFEIEIIVVDDASSDATAEVVRRYDQVRYLRFSQRKGVSAAQNAGICMSRGQYISVLGADDTWLPHKLRVQVPLLQAHPEVAVVYGQTFQRCGGKERLLPNGSSAPSGWVFEAMLVNSFAGHLASVLIRREAFDKAGYFDESLITYEDYDLALRLAFHFQFLFEPGAVSIYNLSPHGSWLTRAASGDASKDCARVIEKALQMLPVSARYAKVREEAPIRIAFGAASPFVAVGDLTQAWERVLVALRTYPTAGNRGWVRGHVRWVALERLIEAASPLTEARDLSAQIKAATLGGGVVARLYTRSILAEIWSDVLLLPALRSRLSFQEAAYAAFCMVSYAPQRVAFGALRTGRGLLISQAAKLYRRMKELR